MQKQGSSSKHKGTRTSWRKQALPSARSVAAGLFYEDGKQLEMFILRTQLSCESYHFLGKLGAQVFHTPDFDQFNWKFQIGTGRNVSIQQRARLCHI